MSPRDKKKRNRVVRKHLKELDNKHLREYPE